MTKKKIDNEVFLRFFIRLFTYPFYVGDKLITCWKVSETPSFADWLRSERVWKGQYDSHGEKTYFERKGKIVKIKNGNGSFEQLYRTGSIIRVVTAAVICFIFYYFF